MKALSCMSCCLSVEVMKQDIICKAVCVMWSRSLRPFYYLLPCNRVLNWATTSCLHADMGMSQKTKFYC